MSKKALLLKLSAAFLVAAGVLLFVRGADAIGDADKRTAETSEAKEVWLPSRERAIAISEDALVSAQGQLDWRTRELSSLQDKLNEAKNQAGKTGASVGALEAEKKALEEKEAILKEQLRAKQAEQERLRQEQLLRQQEQRQGQVFYSPPQQIPPQQSSGGIILSFDDSSTPARANAILDVLSQKGAKAVFCVNGNWSAANPAIISRMRAEGHSMCNHTASHPDLTKLSDEAIRTEILNGALPGDDGRLRPPYGAYDSRVKAIAVSAGYFIYLWSIDTRDWAGTSEDAMLNEVLRNLRPGAVVLMHLHGANTLAALPRIIDGIRAAGYQVG